MERLTKSKLEALKPGSYPRMVADGQQPGLYIRVQPNGKRYWIQRISIKGKRRDIGLGRYPVVDIREAREAAFENERTVYRGGDPLAEKREAQRRATMPTFEQAAIETHAVLAKDWKTDRQRNAWIRTLQTYAYPLLAGMKLDAIGRADVLRILTPIWTKKGPTARLVRRSIKDVLSWGMSQGWIDTNEAGTVLDGALPKKTKATKNYAALPYREIAEALERVRACDSAESAKLLLQLSVFTAVRPSEARLATWSEIDLEARTWTIPASRMKKGREHRVPLSDAAANVLENARVLEDRSGVVFPSPMKQGRPLSDRTLPNMLENAGLKERATVHGFRSSFRDWCAETGKARELAEAALAHVVPGVEGDYFRSDLFERRRRLMAQWGSFVTQSTADVVDLPLAVKRA